MNWRNDVGYPLLVVGVVAGFIAARAAGLIPEDVAKLIIQFVCGDMSDGVCKTI